MNRDQFAFTFTKILKRRPNLANIPEDVSEVIADVIKSWATIEGDLEQREMARRVRDSALRAVALSCRRAHRFYSPILLQDVTLDFRHLFSFYQALLDNQGYGHSIRSLTFSRIVEMTEEEQDIIESQLASLSKAPLLQDSENSAQVFQVSSEFHTTVFQRLASLQTLLVLDRFFIPRSLKQLVRFSLKRLFISHFGPARSGTKSQARLNARNVIWLLTFGVLEEACLSLTISTSDFDFLREHHQAFANSSKIKKLSLSFYFAYRKSDRRTWWGTSRESNMELESGNMKTEALSLLLQVVDGPECLEVYAPDKGDPNLGDDTLLNLRYILQLKSLFGKLLHLRLFNSIWDSTAISLPVYPCLRTLTVDVNFLYDLVNLSNSKLPSSLERLVLPYYLASGDGSFEFSEDQFLAQIISSQMMPNLKEVVVPLTALKADGEAFDSSERSKELKTWADRREKLESEPVFKSGKIQLRKVGPGLKVTSDEETFMSHFCWLAPP